jgi:DNA-directed RNA polymerase subunit D
MEIIEKKENKIVFKEKIEESLVNALRRYLGEIPILAINELEISRNDSPLYDETVAHRIGLIPLKMNKKYNNKTELKINLKSKKEGMVYSGELKGDAEIVYDKIPLTFLNKGQELEISCTAIVGQGKDHAKFSPGLLFYRNVVDIKLDKDCSKEIVNVCPKGIFELEGNKIVVKDKDKCDMCEMCIDFCKKTGKESVKILPTDELIITLESFGQMENKDILNSGINVLKKDLENVSKQLK